MSFFEATFEATDVQSQGRGWRGTVFFILILLSGAAAGPSNVIEKTQISGSWVSTQDSGYLLGIEGDRYIVALSGRVRGISKILSNTGSRLHLCEYGRDVFFEVSFHGAELVLQDIDTGETRRFHRLSERPRELMLEPIRLPAPMPLPQQRILAIQGETWRRFATDQKGLQDPGRFKKQQGQPSLPLPPPRELSPEDLRAIAVQAENTAFLKDLVQEVGWIDVGRFGYSASNAAFILVQHSGDLPLMIAVLEAVRHDVEAGHPMGEGYALLYDRVQLMQGEKQLYGSQVGSDVLGQRWLHPVQDPEGLEERRKVFGMLPISQYLKIFGAPTVRISPACSAPDSIAELRPIP